MKRLAFVVHNHQPVGNFDNVIREAFEKSYKPFVDVVYSLAYPKVCFHFSGILYDWLSKNEPLYLEKIKEMVKRNQIEILSGGYYEPILSVICERDRVSQIRKMSDYIVKKFDFHPMGLWLTERVYNPAILKSLRECGIKYTLVDDTSLFLSVVYQDKVNDCFITEYEGERINIFTINHKLRYLIPYQEAFKTVEYINGSDGEIFVMADDGEKFGLWPKSYKLVYEEKWLINFFETIKNSNIEMTRLCDFIEEKKGAKKLVYIPNTSYFELSQWALDADDSFNISEFKRKSSTEFEKFIKGGFFENFFVKYPQANLIHKRNLFVSNLLSQNYDPVAENHLHMAQCNCGWWHGVFGGIYLPHIRMAIYENLLKAQKIVFNKSKNAIQFEKKDIDFDGAEDLLIETDNNFFIISPSYGGSITEFSSKNRFVNYSCIMDRRKEAYHLTNSSDINGNRVKFEFGKNIFYDWHRRAFLLDHFLSEGTKIDDFMKLTYGEVGDFIPQPYKYSVALKDDMMEVFLSRDGVVWDKDRKVDVSIYKKIIIKQGIDGFRSEYSIVNRSDFKARFTSATEMVFAFSNINVAPFGEVNGVSEYIFHDSVRGNIKLSFSIPVKLWIFPIETISNSENGVEKTYQGSVVCCVFERDYESKESFNFSFEVLVL
ncbi:MAG: DUF1926 domain-containing protein [Elusimicrobiota bacterium]